MELTINDEEKVVLLAAIEDYIHRLQNSPLDRTNVQIAVELKERIEKV